MNGDRKYWLKEAYLNLELALLGVRKKTRDQINDAIECLEKFEQELKRKKK